jgi:hypothetical protein
MNMKQTALFLVLWLLIAVGSWAQTNNALAFDGIDDNVSCSALNPATFTAEAWVYPGLKNADQAIVSTLSTNNNTGFELHISDKNYPIVTVRNGSDWTDVTASSIVSTNSWVHLAATFDGSTCKLYVNGALSASASATAYYPGTETMYIGQRASGTRLFTGKIDEVRVWNTVRTQSEIISNFRSSITNAKNLSNLVAYYTFNQGTAGGDNSNITALADSSVTAGNGTLNNFALTNGNTTSNFVSGYDTSAINTILKTSSSKVYLAYESGSTNTFTVSSNTTWALNDTCSWITLSSSSGTGSDVITVTATSENTTEANRSATITLSADGVNDIPITLVQILKVPATIPTTGNGSSSSPYQIATIDNLYWLSQSDSVWNKDFIQTANIDASVSLTWDNGNGFSPIGNNSTQFTGQYNGKGYTIDALTINHPSDNYVGLFGYTDGAVIDSVRVTNCNVTGHYYTGGLVGYSNNKISHSFTSGTVTGSSDSYDQGTGGLIGYAKDTVIYCYSSATVSGDYDVGGLIGSLYAPVYDSYATGDVSGYEYVGGVVGDNSNIIIKNCYATGKVSGINYVGGAAGVAYNGTTIDNCYATGNVSGTSYIGGLTGENYSGSVSNSYATCIVSGTSYIGGLTGYNFSSSSISNSFATGNVSGSSSVGGLTGENDGSTVSASYWNIETSGDKLGYGYNSGTFSATGLTTIQMKEASNLTDLGSFSGTWEIREDSTYAALRGVSNNAPFAFRDTASVAAKFAIKNLLKNDYDFETIQNSLTMKIVKLYGAGSTDSTSWFAFPADSALGYTDSILYRVGEIRASLADTLWGNTAVAVLKRVNSVPVITSTPSTSATTNVEYTYTITATDFDGDALTYNINGQPTGMGISSNVITWTPGTGVTTSGEVTLSVSDGSLSATQTFTITVNNAPVITSTVPATATENVEYSYTVTATDANNDALTYSLSGQPTGMKISGNVISWTPATGTTTSGEVTLTVSDGSLSATQTFTITINNAPVITSTAPETATENVEYTYTVTATDANNDALTYSLSGQPTAMAIIGNVISWIPAIGTTTSGEVTLTVSDGSLSATQTFTITVNNAPVITSTAPETAIENVEYTYTVTASDANNDALTYSLSGQPTAMAITGNVISWIPATGTTTSGEVTLTVSDGYLSASQTFTIAVNNAPVITSTAPATATENVEYTYTVTATDANNDGLTYSLSGQPTGMAINGNMISWTPTTGTITSGEVTLTVSDGSLLATQTFTITVNNAPIITSTAPETANAGVEYTYTVTATDANNDALTYSLSGQPTGMKISGNVISWTPATGTTTSGEVTLTVSDGNLSASQTFTIAVNNAPVITSTAPETAIENVEYTYTVTATDANNDALTYSLSGEPAGMTISGNVISWTPATGITTSGEVTLTVSDGSLSDTETFTITVTSSTGIIAIAGTDIALYPNPASNVVYIAGTKGMVYIYDLNGRLKLTQAIADNGSVTIGSLVPGVYVVKINGKDFKLIKE